MSVFDEYLEKEYEWAKESMEHLAREGKQDSSDYSWMMGYRRAIKDVIDKKKQIKGCGV